MPGEFCICQRYPQNGNASSSPSFLVAPPHTADLQWQVQNTAVSGAINSIVLTNSGNNYTSAIATITPASGDTTGTGGAAIVNLQGSIGTLRTYYFNNLNAKTIFNGNVGTIDYNNGLITLNSFSPIGVDNPLGQFAVTANPTTTIVSSSFNRIITIDPFDPNAIVVNVTAKTS